MEWLSCIRKTIEIIESDLGCEFSVEDIAGKVFVSPYFLQKGFAIMTGYTLSEYSRGRRLYEAALELQTSDKKVIDIALDYGYETPESFTKAFTRFHGLTPIRVRAGEPFRTFLPLRISISVQGGNSMDMKTTKMFPFKLIGFEREFTYENAQSDIPKFWDELCEKYAANVYAGNPPANAWEKALVDNCIGEFGVCIDDLDGGRFRYLVAGRYTGGEVPEGMTVYEFPGGDWAVFDCFGPAPEAIQQMNSRVFNEWLPGNPDYELSGNASIEWYDCINGEKTDADYHSAVWLPIRKKA